MKELRIYVIDNEYLELNKKELKKELNVTPYSISQNTDDKTFIEVAEFLGGVMSLGYFIQAINDQELDNLTNSLVRAYIIETDDENAEPIEIADIETQIYEKLGV